jgi:hypothetical protein
MSNKTRSVLKGVAIALVVLAIIMHMSWVIVPLISPYKFWMVVSAFAMLLVVSK